MTFWNDSAFEPKRVFRWKVSLLTAIPGAAGGAGTNVPAFFAKKITKPVLTVEEAEHKYLNKSFYFPGHLKWDPVTVTLIDDNSGTIVDSITSMFKEANYSVIDAGDTTSVQPPGSDTRAVATLPKLQMVNGAAAGQNVEIEQLDADGSVIETIILHNAWVKSFKPTELTYDLEDLSMYDVEFRYDWASYESR
jgi:hypothetical protein